MCLGSLLLPGRGKVDRERSPRRPDSFTDGQEVVDRTRFSPFPQEDGARGTVVCVGRRLAGLRKEVCDGLILTPSSRTSA